MSALAGGALNMVAVTLALLGSPRLQQLILLRIAAFFMPAVITLAAFALSHFGIGLGLLLSGFAGRLRVRVPAATVLGIFLLF